MPFLPETIPCGGGDNLSTILSLKNVNSWYKIKSNNPFRSGEKEKKQVLKDITFSMKEGEILGLVGESGCGKSTLAKVILGFVEDIDGTVERGTDQMQMIFQDPYGSLNPRKKIGWILEEPLRMQGKSSKELRRQKVEKMLKKVGLDPSYYDRYPRELSGGQRQRVSIAIALIQGSKLILADEPVSALDVTIQKQIMELMLSLQEEMGLSYLFISHDLNVIYQMCDRVMVMKNGRIVEIGDVEQVYNNPKSDYTKKLLEASC